MRIGILGGSFDPVHNGHVKLGQTVLEKDLTDEVWFLPCSQQALKKDMTKATAEQRVEMLKLAIADNPKFKVCTLEVEKGGISYTVETMKTLKKMFPEHEFTFIMGMDCVETFLKWKNPYELLNLCKFILFKRPGIQIYKHINDETDKLFETILEDVSCDSSTELRKILAQKPPMVYHQSNFALPDNVTQYIVKNGIYQERKEE